MTTLSARKTLSVFPVSRSKPPAASSAAGFVVEQIADTRLRGRVELGEDHFRPWGVVRGGVHATIVESAIQLTNPLISS